MHCNESSFICLLSTSNYKTPMKYLQVVAGILLIGMVSCESNQPIELDYCAMLTKDQSFVNHGETDSLKRASNYFNRKALFLENFEQLLERTKREGFPQVHFEELPKDSCKNWAITMTLIHMAQAQPDQFFKDEIISLFQNEIKKGNLQPEDLAPAFRVSFTTNEFCEALKAPIQRAVLNWELGSHLDKEPRFKKCD